MDRCTVGRWTHSRMQRRVESGEVRKRYHSFGHALKRKERRNLLMDNLQPVQEIQEEKDNMILKSFKKCADCEKSFRPYKSTDKYCSPKCALKHFKPLKSKPKIYKPKIKPTKSDNFKKEFDKQRKKIKNNLIKEYGLLICEKCGATKTIQFSTHHIIFRSETPSHPELNNLLNLIHLCYDCHESFHTIKISRNYLIKERNLKNLFGNIWGYEK